MKSQINIKTKNMKTSMKGGSPKGAPMGSKPGSAGMKTQKVVAPTNKQSKASNNIPKAKTATKGK